MTPVVKIHCACGKVLRAPENLWGKAVRCPHCGRPIDVPHGPSASEAPPRAGTLDASRRAEPPPFGSQAASSTQRQITKPAVSPPSPPTIVKDPGANHSMPPAQKAVELPVLPAFHASVPVLPSGTSSAEPVPMIQTGSEWPSRRRGRSARLVWASCGLAVILFVVAAVVLMGKGGLPGGLGSIMGGRNDNKREGDAVGPPDNKLKIDTEWEFEDKQGNKSIYLVLTVTNQGAAAISVGPANADYGAREQRRAQLQLAIETQETSGGSLPNSWIEEISRETGQSPAEIRAEIVAHESEATKRIAAETRRQQQDYGVDVAVKASQQWVGVKGFSWRRVGAGGGHDNLLAGLDPTTTDPVPLKKGESVQYRIVVLQFGGGHVFQEQPKDRDMVRIHVGNLFGDHELEDITLRMPEYGMPGKPLNPKLEVGGGVRSHAIPDEAVAPGPRPGPEEVGQRLQEGLRLSDPMALAETVLVWHADKPIEREACEGACRRVLERGRSMGIAWKRATLTSSRPETPGLRLTFSADAMQFEIWLDNGAVPSQPMNASVPILGPAPRHADLRLEASLPSLHRELRWLVPYGGPQEGRELWDVTVPAKKRLTRDGGKFPYLSPNGKAIIYIAQTGGAPTYHLANLEGQRIDLGVEATEYSGFPRWSDDSRLCIVAEAQGRGMLSGSNGATAIIDVEQMRIIRPVTESRGQVLRLPHRRLPIAWLPGRRKLCLAAIQNPTDSSLSIIDVDSGKTYGLCSDTTDMKVSPDGEWVAACRTDREAHVTRMLAARTDGGSLVQLAAVPDVMNKPWLVGFSPDNRYFCYLRLVAPKGFYIVATDGNRHERLLPGDHTSTAACSWASNASTILFDHVGIQLDGPRQQFTVEKHGDRRRMSFPPGWLFPGREPPFSYNADDPQNVIEPQAQGLTITYVHGKVSQMTESRMLGPAEATPTDAEGTRELPSEYGPNLAVRLEVEDLQPKKLPSQIDDAWQTAGR
ncbi:MAG TPA: hypothetical protein VMY37_38315 [Thermoguttaceae bacterium]|nr:hypothetical protein [Thermoguttaceae bacterium]